MAITHSDLRDLAFFAGFSTDEFAIVWAVMETAEMAPGTVVFNEGDAGDRAYLVAAGAVEVSTRICGDVEKTLLTLRGGGVFGELSLLTGEARSGTARVVEQATLLSLAAPAFEKLVAEQPSAAGKLMRFFLVTLGGAAAAHDGAVPSGGGVGAGHQRRDRAELPPTDHRAGQARAGVA